VPLTVATVLGSIGVAAGGAAFSSEALDDCSVSSFLLHAAKMTRQQTAKKARKIFHLFAFMI
jgi:hypothetical protein